jgi:hypothetical protein
MNMKIFDPTMKYICSMQKDEVSSFLLSKSMKALKTSSSNELIIFDSILDELIGKIISKEITCINTFTTRSKLIDDINHMLENRGIAIFFPSHKSLRHFYNLSGFIDVMNDIVSEINNSSLIIPPGIYGRMYLFGLIKMEEC